MAREYGGLELLTELLRRFDQIPDVQDGDLALAVGVSPSQVTNWRRKVKSRTAINPNRAPKNEILCLLGLGEDERTPGMEWMLAQMRTTVEGHEAAARVRRELREWARSHAGDEGIAEDLGEMLDVPEQGSTTKARGS